MCMYFKIRLRKMNVKTQDGRTQCSLTHTGACKRPDRGDAVDPTINPGSEDEWGSHASPEESRAQPPPLSTHSHTLQPPHIHKDTHTHTHRD